MVEARPGQRCPGAHLWLDGAQLIALQKGVHGVLKLCELARGVSLGGGGLGVAVGESG